MQPQRLFKQPLRQHPGVSPLLTAGFRPGVLSSDGRSSCYQLRGERLRRRDGGKFFVFPSAGKRRNLFHDYFCSEVKIVWGRLATEGRSRWDRGGGHLATHPRGG